VKHLVAATIALKGIGGIIFIFGSSLGAYLLVRMSTMLLNLLSIFMTTRVQGHLSHLPVPKMHPDPFFFDQLIIHKCCFLCTAFASADCCSDCI